MTIDHSRMPIIKFADTELNYTIRHSTRARHWRISISTQKMEIVVPRRARQRAIDAIIHKKRDWIYKHWKRINSYIPEQKLVVPKRWQHGENIPYRGQLFPLLVEFHDIKKPKVFFSDTAFHVSLPGALAPDQHEAAIEKHVMQWLDRQLRADVEKIFAQYSALLGCSPKSYRVKQQRTLWGSCSHKGNININFRLIYTPYAALEYVVVHELCHLKHNNHSKRFWDTVESLLPDYKTQRTWLRRNAYILGCRG